MTESTGPASGRVDGESACRPACPRGDRGARKRRRAPGALQPRQAPTLCRLARRSEPADRRASHCARGGGGLLGVIPSSINLLAVDVDTDAAGSDLYASMLHRRGLVEKAIGEPLATLPTRSGGGHMLYRAPEGEVGNRRWLYGDIRGTRGYCVVWDAARWLAAMSAAPAAEPVNVNALPLTRNGGHHGPVAIAGAPVGERNDTLNREAFKAVATAKRDGTVVDLRPHRDAALDAGLSADEVDRTLDSAIAGGIEKGDKPAAPRQRPPVPPMRKLLADDDDTETPDAIVPGLLWDGCVTMLTAAAKAGKTTLLAHAVGAAYTSAVFLGERCGGDSGRPLCIWSEMPLGMLRTWVRRHIDNPEAPIYADCMRSVDQIREQVDQLKPQAVIVDSLTAMAAARESNADLWRATDVRSAEGVACRSASAIGPAVVRRPPPAGRCLAGPFPLNQLSADARVPSQSGSRTLSPCRWAATRVTPRA